MQKRTAKRIFYEGSIVYLCPNKLRPGDPWHPEVAVSMMDGSFDDVLLQFRRYNCNPEAGMEIDYYVRLK